MNELLEAAERLVDIVEGVRSPNHPWRSKSRLGERLKDTPEWCKFYVEFNKAKKANEHLP